MPTEAEWEYAAKGGNLSNDLDLRNGEKTYYKYAGSDNGNDVAWYYQNSGRKIKPVGNKKTNELGIYDMSGNILEWCNDWFGNYSKDKQNNPKGPKTVNFEFYAVVFVALKIHYVLVMFDI